MHKVMRLRQPANLDALYLDSHNPPLPQSGEIRVRIHAASLNFRDGLVINGFFPAKDGLIPLSDGAGVITDIGDGVTEFAVGDHVVSVFHPKWQDGHRERAELDNAPGGPADGFAAECVTRPASHFTHAPAGYSHIESATLTCAGVTAWRAVITDGAVKPGSTVLIQGTGGVSLFALQFAKMAGAQVIATSSSAKKLELLRNMGADHVINYTETPNWGEVALALTGGLGADHIIEVGGPNTLPQSLIAARTGGHIAIIGAVAGFDGGIPFAIVQAKRIKIQGVTVGSCADQRAMIKAIEANGVRPVIGQTFPLEQLADAFRAQQAGEIIGKICIEM